MSAVKIKRGGPRIKIVATDSRADNTPMEWEARVEWPDRDVMVLRNALPFLSDLPAVAEAHGSWKASKTIDSAKEAINESLPEQVEPSHRSSSSMVLYGDTKHDPHPLLTAYSLLLKGVEGNLIHSYMRANIYAQVAQSSGYELLRYREGERFGEHVDIVRGHPELAHRRLAFVAFCNYVENGGRLVFPRQNLRIAPEPGLAVIFPASFTHPHESTPVRRGVKYSVVSWYL